MAETATYHAFPGCCGAGIIYCLGHNWADWKLPTLTTGHVYFAILSEVQLAAEPILLQGGFRKISDQVINKNSGKKLHVYIRDLPTPVEQPKQSVFQSGPSGTIVINSGTFSRVA